MSEAIPGDWFQIAPNVTHHKVVHSESFHSVYVLRSKSGLWVCKVGYTCGVGSWMRARHFDNAQAAEEALKNPEWHNDPEGVRACTIARLVVSVEATHYEC